MQRYVLISVSIYVTGLQYNLTRSYAELRVNISVYLCDMQRYVLISVSIYVTGLFNYIDTQMNNYPNCPFRQTPRSAATNEPGKQAATL